MRLINLQFLLNQMNYEIITEGKLGEDRNFPHSYNIS